MFRSCPSDHKFGCLSGMVQTDTEETDKHTISLQWNFPAVCYGKNAEASLRIRRLRQKKGVPPKDGGAHRQQRSAHRPARRQVRQHRRPPRLRHACTGYAHHIIGTSPRVRVHCTLYLCVVEGHLSRLRAGSGDVEQLADHQKPAEH